MIRTNLRVIGIDAWGNRVSMPVYQHGSDLYVKVKNGSGLRRSLQPYKCYAKRVFGYYYLKEGGVT